MARRLSKGKTSSKTLSSASASISKKMAMSGPWSQAVRQSRRGASSAFFFTPPRSSPMNFASFLKTSGSEPMASRAPSALAFKMQAAVSLMAPLSTHSLDSGLASMSSNLYPMMLLSSLAASANVPTRSRSRVEARRTKGPEACLTMPAFTSSAPIISVALSSSKSRTWCPFTHLNLSLSKIAATLLILSILKDSRSSSTV
mmetsp:Transcript_23873/g.66855  ORF Transcript_23873/g.66855 Transcript_23873/m.66855 type:complete len:201 (-) Transcript_23873:1268-1870(-)